LIGSPAPNCYVMMLTFGTVFYTRISQACGLIAAATGIVALLGWVGGVRVLSGISLEYIPMAPNTALAFTLLGFSLAALPLQSKRSRVFVRTSAGFVIAVAAARLFEYAAGVQFGIDGFFFEVRGEELGLAPLGKMGLFTAVNFHFTAAATLIASFQQRRHLANDAAKGLASVAAFVGLAFTLGYFYGSPLLYGGQSIPMALNTSICFVLVGAGVATRAFFRDALERRQVRDELSRAHQELEQRVEERTAQLAHTNETLSAEIAERAGLQQQLAQAQKMEAVGRLAGGVAHDFNNVLTTIIGYSDLVLMQLSTDDPLRRELDEIRRAGERAATLTRQLLAFSRKQMVQPRIVNINNIVTETSKFLGRLIGEDIEMVTTLEQELWHVKADPGQLEQVLMNLVVNARDAMTNGGKLTIETFNVSLNEDYSLSHLAVTPGRYVILAVSDNGCGMDADTQAHIFEPFFTTKEHGKGTGLGLSTVYGIVKQSGGYVWVYSEPDQGTTFKVYFPQTTEEAETLQSGFSRPQYLRAGKMCCL
jgi:signal transduction histidine kinase